MSTCDPKSEQNSVLFNQKEMGRIQGLSLSGDLTNGELDLGHGVDFTSTMQLSLEDALELLKTITRNAPLRSVDSVHKVNVAIAELKMKSGFHLIQHELQKSLDRKTEEMNTIDPEESPRELFHRHVSRAIRKGDQTLTVFVELPFYKKPEMIVNPPENLVEKLTYYMGAYDENMRMKSKPEIRIRAFEVAGPNDSGTGIEFN